MATINFPNGTQLTANFASFENGTMSFSGGSGFNSLTPPPTGVKVTSDTTFDVSPGYVRKVA